jgi:aminopeptidase N
LVPPACAACLCLTGSGCHAKSSALTPTCAQVASRLASAFTNWKCFDQGRQAMMRAQLERISASEGLSENVFEIVSKSLK